MNSVAEEYTLHDNHVEKKKTTKSNTAASVSTNGGRQGRREGETKSLADDNRHPDKNSQHTRVNTLLNVFSRQDTRKQHVRLLSLSLSLSPTNNAMITSSSTRTQLIVTPSLSLAYRHFVKILVCSVELAEKLDCTFPLQRTTARLKKSLGGGSTRGLFWEPPRNLGGQAHTLAPLGGPLRFTAAGESHAWPLTASRRGPLPRSAALNT